MMNLAAFPSTIGLSGKRLFLKIFLVFWLAMSVAGVVLLAIEAQRAVRLQERTQALNGAAVAFYAVSVVKDHEDEKTWQSRAFLKDLEARTGIRGWLFDPKGREVSGHDKSELWNLQKQTSAITQLRKQAESETNTVFEPLNSITLAAHTAAAPSGKRYTFVGVMPNSRFGPWNARPIFQVLRILALLTTAGIVSWFLALNLARPIANLRDTTQRLAQGDLTARTSPLEEYRRDELGDLSRDFNLMAERLEISMQEQNRLYQAQKLLLGDVAHELRSPLARINVALELARDAGRDAARISSEAGGQSLTTAHDRIEREVGRLGDLIGRLLTLSRLESGVQKREDTPIDLWVLVQGVVEDADYEAGPDKHVALFRPTIGGKSEAQDESEADEDAWIVEGSPELLLSAVENVVRNAVRHTARETAVEVTISRERNDAMAAQRWNPESQACFVSPPPSSLHPPSFTWAIVSVKDHGPGVEEGELRQLFLPFYRAGKGRAQRDGGVGLGLAITLGAIELHGGQVRACNAGNGGLLVELRLPLYFEMAYRSTEGEA